MTTDPQLIADAQRDAQALAVAEGRLEEHKHMHPQHLCSEIYPCTRRIALQAEVTKGEAGK